MPVMFWYFPFIVFSGVCDMMLSQDKHVRTPPSEGTATHRP
jgi:hypothetical protein